MGDDETSPSEFLSVRLAAAQLGLPAAWLKREVSGKRLPHLKIGRRVVLRPALVKQALLDRAAKRGLGSEGGRCGRLT